MSDQTNWSNSYGWFEGGDRFTKKNYTGNEYVLAGFTIRKHFLGDFTDRSFQLQQVTKPGGSIGRE